METTVMISSFSLEPPSRTVTFLFTDSEGSTKLLHQLRDQYTTMLADHRHILRQVFFNWNGHEVDSQADTFFVAFPRKNNSAAVVREADSFLSC
jgi:class 3 adenylate cyclase